MRFDTTALISTSLQQNDATYLLSIPQHLFTGSDRVHIAFIYEFYTKFNRLPGFELLNGRFGAFNWNPLDAPLRFVYENVTERLVHSFTTQYIDEIRNNGLFHTIDSISKLHKQLLVPDPTMIDYALLDRKTYFKDMKIIATGIPFIDDWLGGGIANYDLGLIFGRSKAGKSTLLEALIHFTYSMGYNVLVYANENTPTQIALKLDAWGAKVNSANFRNPDKFAELAKATGAYQRRIKGRKNKLILGGQALTVDKVLSGITSSHVKPDIIFVDSVNLMNFRSEDTATQSLSIGDALKAFRNIIYEHKIPIIGTAQANRTGADTEELGSENIADSDKYAMYVDWAFGVSKVKRKTFAGSCAYHSLNRHTQSGQKIYMSVDYDTRAIRLHSPLVKGEDVDPTQQLYTGL